jgi:hypothetical protein
MNRNSNIEILRILSMFLIVMHHYSFHGGFTLDPNIITINKVIVQFLAAGGKLGVDCFVLITGYFLIKSSFKIEKLIKLWFSVFTYSSAIYIIFSMSGLIDFSYKQAIKSFFPIIFSEYGFATSYVLLYIFSPYLNVLINAIDKKKHFNLIILLVLFWSVIPTITTVDLDFSSLGWFSTLYIMAAYFRLYPNKWIDNFRVNILLSISMYVLILLSILLFDFIGIRINTFGIHATYLTGINKIPTLACAVTLFLGFKNLNIENVKYIEIISSTMFGVYLIHDNNFVRHFLWIDVFRNSAYYQSSYLIFHSTIVIFSVFFICIAIDQTRYIFIEKPFLRLIEIHLKKVLEYFKIKNYTLAKKTNAADAKIRAAD